MTASLATSKQILHSKAALVFESSVASFLFSLTVSAASAPNLFSSLLLDVVELSLIRISFSLILGLAPPLSTLFVTFSDIASLIQE